MILFKKIDIITGTPGVFNVEHAGVPANGLPEERNRVLEDRETVAMLSCRDGMSPGPLRVLVRVNVPFRMRHEPEHATGIVTYACNVPHGAVIIRIFGIF